MRGESPGFQVLCIDYHGRNEVMLLPDGTVPIGEDVFGWYQIAKRYYERYRKPLMHTETNLFDAQAAPGWYNLIDQVDWDIGLSEVRGNIDECGRYDMNRQPRPVADAYRALLREFGRLTVVPQGELFEITEADARLKFEV